MRVAAKLLDRLVVVISELHFHLVPALRSLVRLRVALLSLIFHLDVLIELKLTQFTVFRVHEHHKDEVFLEPYVL